MSRSGYDDYSVGPFDAFYSKLRRSKGRHNTNSQPSKGRERDSGILQLNTHCDNSKANDLLMSELQQLLCDMEAYELQIEETCEAITQTERVIERHRRVIEEQNKSLCELNKYGQSIEYKLSLSRDKIAQVRQRLADIKRGNSKGKLYSSQSRGRSTRAVPSELSSEYIPQPNTVEALTQFHQIPVDFIRKKLVEFRVHYADTKEQRTGWDRCFYNWVINGWKRERHNVVIDKAFEPSDELMKNFAKEGVTAEFCEEEKERFILYWQEQQATFTPKLWQERFKQWIHRTWRRHRTDETSKRPSRPTTEEFANASKSDRFHFNFDEEE